MKSVGLIGSNMAPREHESIETTARETVSKSGSLPEVVKKDLHEASCGQQASCKSSKSAKRCTAAGTALALFTLFSPCHPNLTSIGLGAASGFTTAWCWLSGAELPEEAKPLTKQETNELLKANPKLKKEIERVSKNYAGIGIKSMALINLETVKIDWDDDAMCWFEGPPSIFTFKSE